jgi:hypothetical protein
VLPVVVLLLPAVTEMVEAKKKLVFLHESELEMAV